MQGGRRECRGVRYQFLGQAGRGTNSDTDERLRLVTAHVTIGPTANSTSVGVDTWQSQLHTVGAPSACRPCRPAQSSPCCWASDSGQALVRARAVVVGANAHTHCPAHTSLSTNTEWLTLSELLPCPCVFPQLVSRGSSGGHQGVIIKTASTWTWSPGAVWHSPQSTVSCHLSLKPTPPPPS